MKKIFFLMVLYLIFFAAKLPAQNISLNIGSYFPKDEDFKETYKSHFGIALGSTIGFPILDNFEIYGKATYFSISGIPLVYVYTFSSTGVTEEKSYRDGKATFKQLIFNLGIQYHIFYYRKINFLINSGLVYATNNEDQKSSDGTISYHSEGAVILGFFGGINAERQIGKSNFSVLSELQYDYSLIQSIGDYGGVSLSVGLKYYFKRKP
ncbi:MAG: hypothetical protein J7L94_09750 [Caldisericaceae bacterium]|nr:hypothetical protein [Caldisericaceae bacterium]